MTEWTSELPFRVLSIDGGGIKGTYAAAFLAEWERMTGKRIVDHFDLIVGTSTGGIIALAMGIGLPAADVLRFYEEKGPVIFPLVGLPDRLLATVRHAFGVKHATEPLCDALKEVFGEKTLGEALTRLVIVSYDGSSGDVHLYKTSHHPKFKRDYTESMVDVALATSAAPTFLPAFIGKSGTTMVDGGVWANCPAAVAVVEALTVVGVEQGNVDLLSIGTTEEPLHVSKSHAAGGLIRWCRFAPTLMMQAQAKGALAQAKLLTGNRCVRVQDLVVPGRFKLDNPRAIADLKALGAKAAVHNESYVTDRFLSRERLPFIPFNGPRSLGVHAS